MPKLGRNYEQAVYSFVKTLDPTAEVIFNHHVQDRDTGTLRQCDVWINATFGGHWPLSILVSCKDHSRKLDVGDIGTFINEIHSTGASTGVIYSRVGFTQPALTKAKKNSISCCRVYQNEPADMPEVVVFEQFCCMSCITLNVIADPNVFTEKTWGELFNEPSSLNASDLTIIDEITTEFAAQEKIAVALASGFPLGWRTDLHFQVNDNQGQVKIEVIGNWRCFEARTEATLVDGSYCISSDRFQGQQTGPSIDTYSTHPGEGWNEISDSAYPLPLNPTIIILSGRNQKILLTDALANQVLFS